MNKRLLVAMGGFVLVSLLALSSFAAAAPAAKNTPVPQQAATATPVPSGADEGEAGSPDNAPDLGVGAAAAPVNPGTMSSRIFVFNLDTSIATVSINFLNSAGTSVAAISPFTIKPNGAVAKPLPPGITSPFSGSAVVSSDKNIQAFVTDSNAGNTARDEYDGTLLPNAKLVLPFVRHLTPNTQNSIIAVQNTSGGAANITLNLFDPSGNLVASPTMNGVAPLASAYFNTNNITFPPGGIGSAEITAGGTIALAGSEQTRYLKDTASFRALTSADEGTTLYVGFVERRRNATGTPISWSEIYVRNDGSSPTDIKAEFYSFTGALMKAVTRTQIPAKGVAQFLTNNAVEFGSLTKSSAYFKGWARITSINSPQPVALYSLEAQNSGNKLFGTGGIALTGTKFACGDALRFTLPSQNSIINIVNAGGGPANITVKLYKPSTGAQVGTKTVNAVGANKLVNVSLSDGAFTSAGSSFEGLAVVTSSGPQIFASVYTPYSSGGVTSFSCARLQ
jgi:hypothetical protein